MLLRNLKIEIIRLGLNQYELAQKVGIHETRLSQLIHGRARPTAGEKKLISDILGKDENELFLNL